MKQDEKTRRTQERILAAAAAEFGSKSFDAASLNTICSRNNISKGLIYHNFKNKDELYLQCVKLCYDRLTEYLKQNEISSDDIRIDMKHFLDSRQTFFMENPDYRSIFFTSILQPPVHLRTRIRTLRSGYDAYLTEHYRQLFSRIELRSSVSVEQALNYFLAFQEMFNGYFRDKSAEGASLSGMIEAHEEQLSSLLDLMLYGIAKQQEELHEF